MLNKEKYKDEILELLLDYNTIAMVDGVPCSCSKVKNCKECDFSYIYEGEDCDSALRKWADSEYTEPEIDWNRVPVDTPVLVRNNEEDEWLNRYFYKYDVEFKAFDSGATSWSAGDESATVFWKYCKLARKEDIEKYRKK